MSEPKPLLAPVQPRLTNVRLWKDGAFANDEWQYIGDDQPLPMKGKVIVSLTRFKNSESRNVPPEISIGIRHEVGEALGVEAGSLAHIGVIVLAFPKFTDGRSYSTARRLREGGYVGELRATGDVLVDQLPLMVRSGFDSFELSHAATIAVLERGEFPAVPFVYQRGIEHASEATRFRYRDQRTTRSARCSDTAQ